MDTSLFTSHTYQDLRDSLSLRSPLNQSHLQSEWLTLRANRFDSLLKALLPVRNEGLQTLQRENKRILSSFDAQLSQLLGSVARVSQASALLKQLRAGDPLPQVSKQSSYVMEYWRLKHPVAIDVGRAGGGLQEIPLHVVSGFLRGVEEELIERVSLGSASCSSALSQLASFLKDSEHYCSLSNSFRLESSCHQKVQVMEDVAEAEARLVEHLQSTLSDLPSWVTTLRAYLITLERSLTALERALAARHVPLRSDHIKNAIPEAEYPSLPPSPDMRATPEGRLFIAICRHFDACTSRGVAVDADSSSPSPEDGSFQRIADDECQSILRHLIFELPYSSIYLGIERALAHDKDAAQAMLQRLSLLRGELDDMAALLSLQFALPDEAAMVAARSRFLSGSLEEFSALLDTFADQSSHFSDVVTRFPSLLALSQDDLTAYLTQLRRTNEAAAAVSDLLKDDFLSVSDAHTSTESLAQREREILALKVSPSELLLREYTALVQLTTDAINSEIGISDSHRLAAVVLISGFQPRGREVTLGTPPLTVPDLLKRAIRDGNEELSKPIVDRLVTEVLEGRYVTRQNKSDSRMLHKSFKLGGSTGTAQSVLTRIRSWHQRRAVLEAALTAQKDTKESRAEGNSASPARRSRTARVEPDMKLSSERLFAKELEKIIVDLKRYLDSLNRCVFPVQEFLSHLQEYRTRVDNAEALSERLGAAATSFSPIRPRGLSGDFERSCLQIVLAGGRLGSDSHSKGSTGKGTLSLQRGGKVSVSALLAIRKIITSQALAWRPGFSENLLLVQELVELHPRLHALQGPESFTSCFGRLTAVLDRIAPLPQAAGNKDNLLGRVCAFAESLLLPGYNPVVRADISAELARGVTELTALHDRTLHPVDDLTTSPSLRTLATEENPA